MVAATEAALAGGAFGTWRTWAMALLCALACGWASLARAATYDPALSWRTIETAHFRIHFHQGLEQLADELSQSCETIYGTVSAELRWTARMKTEVVLLDKTDRANGFATAVPYNAITLYVTAPWEDSTLSLYEDWMQAIFTHELTHVLHMETHHGIVAAARAVVGRIASTNDVSPWWMIEGLATFQETRHTAGGRGRSPYVDMIKRAAVVDDAWPWLGNLDGLQAQLPSGNLRYLFGQDFMQYVADQQGADVWTKWIHRYGSGIPYLLPSKAVFGKTLQRLWSEWRDDRRARYGAEIAALRAEGILEGARVSKEDESCSAPAFSPDDTHLVWSCFSVRTGSALWIAEADGSGARKLQQDFGAKTFTWRADSRAFVYAGTHIVNRFNTFSDIYLYDLDSGTTRALTAGARARDPEFSPDGSRLVMVTHRAQDNQLEALTVDQRRVALTDLHDHTQLSTPRFSPDGRALAVSVWRAGQRDLWLYDPQGQPLRRLTVDAANDRDPAWSPDGRWLFFSSDRSGIPNIYAIDLTSERLWQVTRVRTGAAKPAVNATSTLLAYDQYSADGWEVRVLPLQPETWTDLGLLPRALGPSIPLADHARPRVAPPAATAHAWSGAPVDRRGAPRAASDLPALSQDVGGTDNYQMTDAGDVFGEEQDYPFHIPPKRYNPARSLLPRYWAPSVSLTPNLPETPDNPASRFFDTLPLQVPGIQLSASTSATDPLARFGWSAFLTWRSDASFVGGGGSFTLNRWLPVFTVSASTTAVPRIYQVADPSDPEATLLRQYFERRIAASFVTTWPFRPRSSFFAAYDFSDRRAQQAIDPAALPESVPLRGRLGRLSVGYRYAWSQPTTTAISQEDARTFSVVAGVTAPWLGSAAVADDGSTSPITQVQLSAELREYLVNPWVPNHVLALRAATGVAFNAQGQQYLGNWALGGNVGDGAFYVRPPEYRMIRGYPFGADRGDSYWLLAGEYRFPIWRMDRGIGTLPAFFRVLHGAVFVDAGNAMTDVQRVGDVVDGSLVGVGAELRLDTVVWWSGGLDFRLGYATGLTEPSLAIPFQSPRAVYVQLGGAF